MVAGVGRMAQGAFIGEAGCGAGEGRGEEGLQADRRRSRNVRAAEMTVAATERSAAESLPEAVGRNSYSHVLRFEKCLEPLSTELTADAAQLPATKRRLQFGRIRHVDSHATEFQPVGERPRPFQILRVHIGCQTEAKAVRDSEYLIDRST